MYISARFAALSRKFRFNFRRLGSRLGNLEIAVFSSDKREDSGGKRKADTGENVRFLRFLARLLQTIADGQRRKSSRF